MALLPKCKECGRLGGYAEKESDKVCARCKQGKTTNAEGSEEEEKYKAAKEKKDKENEEAEGEIEE